MGRPELECPARSTYTSGQRGETNKALEKEGEGATTAKIFGAAMELVTLFGVTYQRIGEHRHLCHAMGYLVVVYQQYLATQPVRLLPAADCV